MDDYKKYVNMKKTEETFGPITNTYSKVMLQCECGNEWSSSIRSIKPTIKKYGNCKCRSCRSKESLTDEIREKIREKSRNPTNQKIEKLRNSSMECWGNDEYKRKIKKASQKNTPVLWKDEEYRKKVINSIKNNWEKEGFRKKQSEVRKEIWKNPDYKRKQSESRKKMWENPLFRKHYENMWDENGRKEKWSKRSREVWDDPEKRKLLSEKIKSIMKEMFQDPQYTNKVNIYMKGLWNNEDYRNNVINHQKELWKDPKHKEKASKRSKELWNNEKFREKQAQARAAFLASGKDSIIERVAQQILDQLNVGFERQFTIGPWSFDLFIPSHNLLVECQGEYWHSLDSAKKNDASKFTYIEKYFPNLRLIYLYERDFLNPGIIKQKLIRELFDSEFSEDQVDFSFEDLQIKLLNQKEKLPNSYYSEPEEFLQSFHYAGFGRAAKQIFGTFLGEKLIAVCKFASVIRKEVATSLKLKTSEVLELDRFCIHPQYQKKNFASWFLSRCAKLVNDPKITHLVSFADSTFGHSGTIYRAANWELIGTIKPSYHYVNQDGWVLHKKTLYNHARSMKKTEKEYAEENGYQKVWGKEKTKFVYRMRS